MRTFAIQVSRMNKRTCWALHADMESVKSPKETSMKEFVLQGRFSSWIERVQEMTVRAQKH
jgi:hypothetical protein